MEMTVVREALPLYLEGTANKAVLIIHGFTGYPGEFYPLAHTLNDQGYTVSLPRLPGHGTNRKDFMNTGARDWLRHIEESYRDLRARYEDVSVVGLSMGGVMALLLAARYSPRRTVLMAPAMAVGNKLFYLTPILQLFLGPLKSEWNAKEGDSEDRKTLGKEYWNVNIPKQMAQLRKMQKIANRELKNVTSPTLLMLSKKDESVSLNAGDIIKKGVSSSCPINEIILENSHHVLVTGEEKDYVTQCTVEWLEEKENSNE